LEANVFRLELELERLRTHHDRLIIDLKTKHHHEVSELRHQLEHKEVVIVEKVVKVVEEKVSDHEDEEVVVSEEEDE
jgi:hypothetical protein